VAPEPILQKRPALARSISTSTAPNPYESTDPLRALQGGSGTEGRGARVAHL